MPQFSHIDQIFNDGLAVQYVAVSASSMGDNTIVAAVAAHQIRIIGGFLYSAGTVNVTAKSGASTSLSGAMPLVANHRIDVPFIPIGIWVTTSGEGFVINLSAAVALTGTLAFQLVPD